MYFNLIFRTIFMYFFIIFVYRLMGKKEVGQLNIVDLIVSILIAELIALSIQTEKSIFLSIIPIFVLVGIQILISFITLKISKIRYILDGKPTIIINNGKINLKEMKQLRYSLDDLLIQLRLKGINSIEEVKYAILENNGELSILDDYPLPLILDSVINYDALNEIGKDFEWLNNILNKKNIGVKDIFYASYRKGKIFVIKRNELL